MSCEFWSAADASPEQAIVLQALGDSVPTLLYVAGRDGKIRYVNRHWLDFTGLSEAESMGDQWMLLVHPADLPGMQQCVAGNLLAPRTVSAEIRIKRVDGEYRRVSVISTPFYGAGGDLAGFVGTITDETARKRISSKLEETSERLHTLIEAIPDAVVVKDPEGRWQSANAEALRLFDLADIDWQNRTDNQLGRLRPRLAETFGTLREGDLYAWQSSRRYHSVELLRDRAGLPMYFEATRIPLFRANGDGRALVMLGRQAGTRDAAREDEIERSALVFEQNPQGIIITDPEQRILRVNRAFTEITGYLPEEVLGRTPRILSSGIQDKSFYDSMWQSLAERQSWQGEIWNRRKNGEVYPEWLSITALRDSTGRVQQFVGSFSDVAERKRIEEELRRHALFDALTGLGNRALVEERLTDQFERGHRHVALFLVNLSRFGQINFLYGFKFGDATLTAAAQHLREAVGKRGTVGRWAGDRFAIVVPLPDDPALLRRCMAELLHDIQAVFVARIAVDERSVQLRAWIGIAMAPDDGVDAASLIRGAESALANAKRGGIETYCFHTPELEEEMRFRLALEQEIAPALESGDLTVVFQPVADLATGRVTAAEALLRWNHPSRGSIMPSLVIGVAEQCNFIQAIGRFVLHRTCSQFRRWLDEGLLLERVAVNISPLELLNPAFERFLLDLLAAHGLAPEMLELEITESVFIDDERSGVIDLLHSLRAAGVRLVIDDFGTRFSTLSYLHRLPVNALKIDRSFVHGLPAERHSVAVTRAILALARDLDLEVIAEGVETAAQTSFLAGNGCDRLQGFHLSRPVSADTFAQTLHRIETELRSA